MSEEMFDEGYTNIANIDISSVVIKQMQEKYKDKGPNFKCNQFSFYLIPKIFTWMLELWTLLIKIVSIVLSIRVLWTLFS